MGYPLKYRWNLFSDLYFTNQKHHGSADTVKEFWTLFNSIPEHSNLIHRSNVRLFRGSNEYPSVENYRNGGIMHVTTSEENMAQLFMYCCLLAIGGNNDVCGVVLNVRYTANRVSLWTNKALTKKEGEKIVKELEVCQSASFKANRDNKGNSYKVQDMWKITK